MPVDRGGLDYPIKVDYNNTPLGQFRKDAQAARAAMRSLRDEVSAPIAADGAVSQISKLTTGVEASRKASIRRRGAIQQETRQQRSLNKAWSDLNREAQRREAAESKAIQSSRRNFRFQRQAITVTRARAQAEQRITSALDKRLQSEQTLNALRDRGLANDAKLRRSLGLQTEQEKRLQRIQRDRSQSVDRLRRAQRVAGNERLVQIRAEAAALERINRDRIREATNARLSAAGRGDLISGGGATRDPERSLSFFQRLSRAVGAADNRANRASFTFRRLFGILAAFTVARNLVTGFQSIVRILVQTSAQIEKAELGIASLFTAVGDVRDANGQAVTGVEALAIAQEEARRQTNLLRADALRTTATFEQLAETFQVGLAPGLQAGLNVDQIRRFTVQISQAASAIGLEQRQLAEEIRSILGGNISVRQTRIAAALGITNDDIRRAREAGTLFEFLNSRFATFTDAGFLAAQTFEGLVQRVSDGFRLILQTGGIEFFDELKLLLAETVEGFIELNEETGNVQPNQGLVRLVTIVSRGLRFAVVEARRLSAALSSAQAEGFAVAIARVLQLLSVITGGLIEGAVKGVADLTVGFRAVAGILESITGINVLDPDSLRQTVTQLTRLATIALGVVTIFSAWKLAAGAVLVILGPIQTALRAVLAVMSFITAQNLAAAGAWAAANAPILISLAAIAAIAVAVGVLINNTRQWFSEVLGIEVKFLTLVKLIQNSITGAFTRLILRTDFGFQKLVQSARLTFLRIRNFVINTSTAIVESLLKAASIVSDTAEAALKGLREERRKDEAAQKRQLEREQKKLDTLKEQLEVALELQERQEQADFEQIVNENDVTPTITGFLDEITKGTRETLGGLFKDTFSDFIDTGVSEFTAGLDDINTSADQAFSEVQGYIASTSRALKDLRQEIEKIDQQLLSLASASQAGGGIPLGLSGVAEQIGRETSNAIQSYLELTRKLDTEQSQLLDSLARKRQELDSQAIISAEQRRDALAQINILEDQISDIQQERLAAEIKINATASAKIAELSRENAFAESLKQNELEIEATRLRQIGQAETSGNLARLRLLEAERELDLLRNRNDLEQGQIDRNLAFLQTRLSQERQLLQSIRDQKVAQGDTSPLLAAENFSVRAIEQIERQLELLRTRRDLELEITQEKQRQLERERDIALAAEQAPIQAGIFVAAWERLTQLQDVFAQTQNIIGSAIDSFASTMSSLVVDIFDPGKDVSIKERFGRFLQGIASQIISTLVSLAVTAILLNALSGGILGPLVRGLGIVGGAGFAEGGKIDSKAKNRAVAHPAHFRKGVQGRHRGGPGLRKPKGLHPTDNIPIWVANNEWVVKASSVMKAGHDAMARINAGLFDAGTLRAAVGLENTPVSNAVSMGTVASSPGFVSGGRVRQAAQTSAVGGSTSGPAVAIMAPTEETFRRLIEGSGRVAFLDAIESNSEEIKARLEL